MINPTPLRQSATELADRVVSKADTAIHATQSVTNKAFDCLSGSVEAARERASPWVDKAVIRTEQANAYVQGHPMSSILLAAGAGAAVTLVLSWLTRSRNRY